MCGIAGFVSATSALPRATDQLAKVTAMAVPLAHRGPDDAGVWASADGCAAFAHRRLSIIDLSPLGRNPMLWDNGRLAITFNGEIYNFQELRAELQNEGYEFRSRTDTEVILAAYDRWGLASVDRFAGMFAFALWDSSRKRLWLVRDRLGKKPLYYSDWGGGVHFASELKGLLATETIPRVIDTEALRLYLRYGHVPSPYSIYAHIRKLPPAHHLLFEDGRLAITRYWDPVGFVASTTSRNDADAERELEARLRTAVGQRMVADVPLGAFLSGGIDSTLIVALMQEQSPKPVQTFTIRFENPKFCEADQAAAVASHLRTDHHEETCDQRQMLAVVDHLADMFDEPFADSSAVPTYLVSKIAREGVTVAVSGDGGDELFFGYPRYRYHMMMLNIPRPLGRLAAFGAAQLPVPRLRRAADVLRGDEPDRYARFVSWWHPAEISALTGGLPPDSPFYADARARSGNIRRDEQPALLDLVSYLPEDILTKVDRTSMAVGLEVRAPLLDHRVVEFALSLPHAMKYRGRTTKWLLRQMLYKRVPRALVERPKMGFGVPLADWFRGPLRERMDDCVGSPDLEGLGIDPVPIRRIWTDFKHGQDWRTHLLWQMFTLIMWSRRFAAALKAA